MRAPRFLFSSCTSTGEGLFRKSAVHTRKEKARAIVTRATAETRAEGRAHAATPSNRFSLKAIAFRAGDHRARAVLPRHEPRPDAVRDSAREGPLCDECQEPSGDRQENLPSSLSQVQHGLRVFDF